VNDILFRSQTSPGIAATLTKCSARILMDFQYRPLTQLK